MLIIFLQLLRLMLLPCDGFDLPTTSDAHDFIEHGDPNRRVKAIFSCSTNFTDYPLVNIQVYQSSPDTCAAVDQARKCFEKINSMEKWESNICLRSDLSSIDHLFWKGNFGSIGFPTRFTETVSWATLSAYNYTIAMSPMETLNIIGDDRLAFLRWMAENGYKRLLVKTYATFEEAEVPCTVLLRPTRAGNAAVLAHTKDELRNLLYKAFPGETPLVQEAVISKAEVVVYFVAYKGRLINRFLCVVSYVDDQLNLNYPGTRLVRFKADYCQYVPGFKKEILPFLRTVSDSLQINGFAYANIKLAGIDSDNLFYGNEDLVEEWIRRQNVQPGESFVKVTEVHARVGSGLHMYPTSFAKMIRAYFLAHFAVFYGRPQYAHALFAPYFKRVREGRVPYYELVE